MLRTQCHRHCCCILTSARAAVGLGSCARCMVLRLVWRWCIRLCAPAHAPHPTTSRSLPCGARHRSSLWPRGCERRANSHECAAAASRVCARAHTHASTRAPHAHGKLCAHTVAALVWPAWVVGWRRRMWHSMVRSALAIGAAACHAEPIAARARRLIARCRWAGAPTMVADVGAASVLSVPPRVVRRPPTESGRCGCARACDQRP